MLWRLVGFHGSVELHRQRRRGVCGLKERPMTQLGKLSLHNSWIQQLSQSPIHPKRNEDVPEAQSVFCEHQSGPVQSGTSVSHWGPGSWSSGSCLPSRAPPGWWCFGSRTLCWAARWPPAELTERRRPPLVWNKVSFFWVTYRLSLKIVFLILIQNANISVAPYWWRVVQFLNRNLLCQIECFLDQ